MPSPGFYAADGSMNVTVVPGTSYTGLYAADGSINVVKATGSTYVGAYHPCGAWWVTPAIAPTIGALPIRAPDGSLYVSGTPFTNGAQRVNVVSRSLFGTALPLLGNFVTRFSADAIPIQTNNSSLTSWTDSVNSIVAGTIVGTAPLYTTNRLNGKPSVKFNANGGLAIATPGAMKTAIDSLDCTTLIVFRTLGTAGFGALLAASAGGNAYMYVANGTNVNIFSGGFGSVINIPYTGAAFSTLGSTSFSTTPTFSSSGALQSLYVNGGAVSSSVATAIGTGGNTITIGNNAGNNFSCQAEIFDILVWNKPLTPAQYMQAQMWACDKYAQPYPWAGLTRFNVFFGDTITQRVGATDTLHQAPSLA